jgi:Lrp/AsnC family leucine-responsive transcriptional regulator
MGFVRKNVGFGLDYLFSRNTGYRLLIRRSYLQHYGETAAACRGILAAPVMDDIDRKILKELQEDARTSYAELGRRVGLTTPAVIERVRKLEDAGIIVGYRVEIDPAKVGRPITAFVRMSITGVDYSHIIEVAEESNEVLECHRGTGGDSFIIKVAVASVEHLQQVIDKLTPYGITTTAIVLSSPVKRRVIEV